MHLQVVQRHQRLPGVLVAAHERRRGRLRREGQGPRGAAQDVRGPDGAARGPAGLAAQRHPRRHGQKGPVGHVARPAGVRGVRVPLEARRGVVAAAGGGGADGGRGRRRRRQRRPRPRGRGRRRVARPRGPVPRPPGLELAAVERAGVAGEGLPLVGAGGRLHAAEGARQVVHVGGGPDRGAGGRGAAAVIAVVVIVIVIILILVPVLVLFRVPRVAVGRHVQLPVGPRAPLALLLLVVHVHVVVPLPVPAPGSPLLPLVLLLVVGPDGLLLLAALLVGRRAEVRAPHLAHEH
ncbi:hypothetical protein EMH17_29435, partial [Klebsiella pneumoniae]